jgi:alkyl sulfatase BDS1-like metallo-beta-lactamase superfamily hydrolase
MMLENGVLNHEQGQADDSDVTVMLTRDAFNKLIIDGEDLSVLVLTGEIQISGNEAMFRELLGNLDQFAPSFPIATHEPIGK